VDGFILSLHFFFTLQDEIQPVLLLASLPAWSGLSKMFTLTFHKVLNLPSL